MKKLKPYIFVALSLLLMALLSCSKDDSNVIRQDCLCKYDADGKIDMPNAPDICKQICSGIKIGQ